METGGPGQPNRMTNSIPEINGGPVRKSIKADELDELINHGKELKAARAQEVPKPQRRETEDPRLLRKSSAAGLVNIETTQTDFISNAGEVDDSRDIVLKEARANLPKPPKNLNALSPKAARESLDKYIEDLKEKRDVISASDLVNLIKENKGKNLELKNIVIDSGNLYDTAIDSMGNLKRVPLDVSGLKFINCKFRGRPSQTGRGGHLVMRDWITSTFDPSDGQTYGTVFKDCSFENVDLGNDLNTDAATAQRKGLGALSLYGTTVDNCTFTNCRLDGVSVQRTKKVLVLDESLHEPLGENSSLLKERIEAPVMELETKFGLVEFDNCDLNDVELAKVNFDGKLEITNSTANKLNLTASRGRLFFDNLIAKKAIVNEFEDPSFANSAAETSVFRNVNFSGAQVKDSIFDGSYIEGVNFAAAILDKTSLKNSTLIKNKFNKISTRIFKKTNRITGEESKAVKEYAKAASLKAVNLSGSSFNQNRLGGVDLRGVNFSDSTWFLNNLADSKLDRADFSGARLALVNFNGTAKTGSKTKFFLANLIKPDKPTQIAFCMFGSEKLATHKTSDYFDLGIDTLYFQRLGDLVREDSQMAHKFGLNSNLIGIKDLVSSDIDFMETAVPLLTLWSQKSMAA